MPNALISRATVHIWSEQIAEDAASHQSSLQRLLKAQRRLSRFIEENHQEMSPATAGVCIYMTSVVARMFDLGGGSLRNVTWAHIRNASAKVQGALDTLLPLDEGFLDRFHATDRAQAHILDEAAMVLMERDPDEEQADLDKTEALKVLLVTWVVTEALDAAWRPPATFEGESTYTYVHLEQESKDKASPEDT